MTLKIPTNFRGINGKEAYEKIMNEVAPAQDTGSGNLESRTNGLIIPPTGDLIFVTDENLYKEIVKYIDKEFSNYKSIFSKNLKFADGVMKGSNTYIATAIDMFCKNNLPEYRLARELDLEQNLQFTADTYNDSGLALRNLVNSNKEQAIYLFNQLKQKGLTENDFPIWFDLRGLELDKNLNFNLTDESFYEKADCLTWADGTKYSKVNKFGLPEQKDNNSSRQIWTSDNALSRCYLNVGSDLVTSNSGLSGSNNGGRVVLAKVRST